MHHFDVIVLGRRIGSLVAATLLARRGFRVLLMPDESLRPTYCFDEFTLYRRPFLPTFLIAPMFRRAIAELAQTQAFARKLVPIDPQFQHFFRNGRLDFCQNEEVLAHELARQFPTERDSILQFYLALADANQAMDTALCADIAWPPKSFFERQEASHAVGHLQQIAWAPPTSYNDVVRSTISHLVGECAIPNFALARLHTSWARGMLAMPGGENALFAYLSERFAAHGGEILASDRCQSIVQSHGRATTVITERSGERANCDFVVGDATHASIFGKVLDIPTPPSPAVSDRRFVVSAVVHRDLTPVSLGAFVMLPSGNLLVREVGSNGTDFESWTICHVNKQLPTDLREQAITELAHQFPAFWRHVRAVDSPHDGLPLWDFRSRLRSTSEPKKVPRSLLGSGGGSNGIEPAEPFFAPTRDGFLGITAETATTAMPNVFCVCPSVLPGLGAEGEVLAATYVARLITKSDPKREKIRKELWSRMEF